MLPGRQPIFKLTMLNTKGMRFPIDVILVCIRWYAAYHPRHAERLG